MRVLIIGINSIFVHLFGRLNHHTISKKWGCTKFGMDNPKFMGYCVFMKSLHGRFYLLQLKSIVGVIHASAAYRLNHTCAVSHD